MSDITNPTPGDKPVVSPTAMISKNIENHKKAALHHEEAAKHHYDAARHHETGNHEKASESNVRAQEHHVLAGDHARQNAESQTIVS